jgi:long-chain acyl-CoA synthetase
VGRALPGIELKIFEPDSEGIGEVIARGPNVMAGYFEDRDSTDVVLKDGWLHTGDLGRLDGEQRLYLVGRQKDVIIDANGKNVYPDELEELYGRHPHLKELSIVGLPDEAGGEKVVCLCVPDYKERPREEVRREIEEHFRAVSAEMPFYRRVKLVRIWDAELPRTSTRKVKRKQVIEELKRLERAAHSGEKARAAVKDSLGTDWLIPILSEVLQRPAAEIRPDSSLSADLGFDSLMLTELAVALEQAGVSLSAVGDLTKINTVEDLRRTVVASGKRPASELRAKDVGHELVQKKTELELPIPEPIARLGKALLSAGQRALYGGIFDVETTGRSFIPQNRNFLVIANHTSHLDMGLVKVTLGEQGERLTALAARDYFFDTPLKRAYFENFTNLIPMERQGSLRESLRMAGEALNQGFNLLIFPEGTRSPTGEIQEFFPTLGYLALSFEVDILPIYLGGTFEALPRGGMWPKNTELKVRIGPPLLLSEMRKRTKGMSRSESYRAVTRLAEEAIRALAAGKIQSLGKLQSPPLAEDETTRKSS